MFLLDRNEIKCWSSPEEKDPDNLFLLSKHGFPKIIVWNQNSEISVWTQTFLIRLFQDQMIYSSFMLAIVSLMSVF